MFGIPHGQNQSDIIIIKYSTVKGNSKKTMYL